MTTISRLSYGSPTQMLIYCNGVPDSAVVIIGVSELYEVLGFLDHIINESQIIKPTNGFLLIIPREVSHTHSFPDLIGFFFVLLACLFLHEHFPFDLSVHFQVYLVSWQFHHDINTSPELFKAVQILIYSQELLICLIHQKGFLLSAENQRNVFRNQFSGTAECHFDLPKHLSKQCLYGVVRDPRRRMSKQVTNEQLIFLDFHYHFLSIVSERCLLQQRILSKFHGEVFLNHATLQISDDEIGQSIFSQCNFTFGFRLFLLIEVKLVQIDTLADHSGASAVLEQASEADERLNLIVLAGLLQKKREILKSLSLLTGREGKERFDKL